MNKVRVENGSLEQLLEMEDSVQVVSNAGFLLSHSKPLTKEQRMYTTLLDNGTKKLADTFNESFLNGNIQPKNADL